MRKVVGTVAVSVGCVIGAGFASGRELLIFFADNHHNAGVAAICCFVFLFAVFGMFLWNGKQFQPKDFTELHRNICGRASGIFDALFLANYLLVLSSMLAASQTLLGKLLGENHLPIYSLATAVVCAAALSFGIDGIKKINLALLPVVFIFIGYITISSADGVAFGVPDNLEIAVQSASYVGVNAMLMCGVLTSCGKNLSKKEIALSAGISAAILSTGIFLILNTLSGKSFVGVEMPLLFLAKRHGAVYWLYAIVVFASIFTTLLSAALPLVEWNVKYTKDKRISIMLVFCFAFCISIYGFVSLMEWTSQIVPVVGICFVFVCILSQQIRRRTQQSLRASYICDRLNCSKKTD